MVLIKGGENEFTCVSLLIREMNHEQSITAVPVQQQPQYPHSGGCVKTNVGRKVLIINSGSQLCQYRTIQIKHP